MSKSIRFLLEAIKMAIFLWYSYCCTLQVGFSRYIEGLRQAVPRRWVERLSGEKKAGYIEMQADLIKVSRGINAT
jgi:hypothetical protein